MANIRPFRAIRPTPAYTERCASLPYDVYNRKEARAVASKDELSFLNIDRPETQFPEDYDMYAEEVYQKAADMLKEQLKSGIYQQDKSAAFYLYELTMDGRSQTGFVACASIDDYVNGVIKKHENTRAEKELDRIHHVDTCNAQTGPIFLSYRADSILKAVMNRAKETAPLFDFVSEDGVGHRGWQIVDAKTVQTIQEAFAGIQAIYIADGHHRAASAVKVGLMRRQETPQYTGEEEFNYFLSVLFPDDELKILDYNRVVKDLNGLTNEGFLKRLQEAADIQEEEAPVTPSKKGQVGMYLDGQWYRLSFKEALQNVDPVEGLDVALLQKYVLTPILGIGDPRTDKRIDFVGGIRGLAELERRTKTDAKVAFSMYPTSMGELFSVADAGLLMPPKSTWFEPKLRSGLFIHSIS